MRTINVFERLNLEFKRRTKKIEAFPSEQSLLRFVVTIMMDTNEKWITGRRYIKTEGNWGMNRIFSKLQQIIYTIFYFYKIIIEYLIFCKMSDVCRIFNILKMIRVYKASMGLMIQPSRHFTLWIYHLTNSLESFLN